MTTGLLHELLDRRADRTPRATAVRCGGRSWSYAELRDHSVDAAGRLRRNAVGRGDRVLILDHRDAHTVALVFAASRLGAIYVVVDDRLPSYYLDHILTDCSPRVVVGRGRAAARVAALTAVRVLEPDPPPAGEAATTPPGRATDVPPAGGAPILATDPVSLIYTSGSTALPKAVVSTHQQVRFAVGAIGRTLGYQADDTVLCCLPLSFDYGLYQAFLACEAGATLVLGGAADSGAVLLRRLIDERVTVLPVVPSLATTLCRLIDRSGRGPDHLRLITNTGAALAAALSARLRAAVPKAAVVAMFGLTECKRVSIAEPDLDLSRPGSVGRPLPGTEVTVLGPDGEPLPPGEVGEFAVRGPHVMAGYWNAPEQTATRFRRDYLGRATLHTGDFGWLDADGYLYFAGRRDDVYKQNGVRVSTTEVEAAALDIPGVQLAVAFAPNGPHGARLAVSGTITPQTLARELRDRLEALRVPAECLVLAELPLTGNGKVDRRAVAARWRDTPAEGS